MPGGDRTGPLGMGPMTGRAAGRCAGYGAPGSMNAGDRGFGMGFGRGGCRGGGRGWRNTFHAIGLTGWQRAAGAPWAGGTPSAGAATAAERQLEALKIQAESFEEALGELRRRMGEIEADKAKA
ncbi:MAG: DUF5320 domain-containing protein [Verrucomicrobia bacterium]|nr:DUF5320 domain-containing protein [Verrucomicrobiota bacterium]